MPVAVDPKSVCHCVSVCHGDGFATKECHRVPLAAQPPATRPWNSPQCDAWSDELERGHTAQLPRQVPCRGLDLAGPGSSPGSEACRSPGPAGARIAPSRVSCGVILSLERPSRQAPLAGVLMLLARSSRQAPLAGASPPWPGKLLLPGPCLDLLSCILCS